MRPESGPRRGAAAAPAPVRYPVPRAVRARGPRPGASFRVDPSGRNAEAGNPYNCSPRHAPMNANLYALLHDHFREDAEQPCLLIPGGAVIHYDDLDAMSGRIAHALGNAGCRPGDRVAAQVDKCWQALALYLACLRAGLVYLPLNSSYQKGELAYFFADAEPSVIVCRPDSAEAIAPLRPQATVPTLDGGAGTLLCHAAGPP